MLKFTSKSQIFNGGLVKRVCLLILLGLLWLPFEAWSTVLTKQQVLEAKRNVKSALSTFGVWEGDLNFKKNVYPDENISSQCLKLLAEPTACFDFSFQAEQLLSKRPWELSSSKFQMTLIGFLRPTYWEKIPPELQKPLENLIFHLLEIAQDIESQTQVFSLLEKQEACEGFAFDTFHLESDLVEKQVWQKRLALEKEKTNLMDTWLAQTNYYFLSNQALKNWLVSNEKIPESLAPQWKVGSRISTFFWAEKARLTSFWIKQFVTQVKNISPSNQAWGFGEIHFPTQYGEVVLGDSGTQLYQGSAFLTVDLGGDDLHDEGGCANGLKGLPLSVAIDLGGNDQYNKASTSLWGVGVCWDVSGNDFYGRKSNIENFNEAAAFIGGALLVDEKGEDHYLGDTFCQAASLFGYAELRDLSGKDTYQVALQGQAYSGVKGLSFLVDEAGDDVYFAGGKYPDYDHYPEHYVSMAQGFSLGVRPLAPGGTAILYDKAGQDSYHADVFGQGASYWYGIGALLDEEGDDHYSLCEYGQGSGIHLAVGLLVDHSGNDTYLTEKGLGQGGTHDFSVGFLWDLAGDDIYSSESGSQGSGINNAVGILLDECGKDLYLQKNLANPFGQGTGGYSPRRGIGSVGLLLDLEGKDQYSRPTQNNTVFSNEAIGAIVDVDSVNDLNAKRNSPIASYEPHRGLSGWCNRILGFLKEFFYPVNGKLDAQWSESLVSRLNPWKNNLATSSLSELELVARGGNPRFGQLLSAANLSSDQPWKISLRDQASKDLMSLELSHFKALVPFVARTESMTRVVIEEWLRQQKTNEALPYLRELVRSRFVEEKALAIYFLGEWGTSSDNQLLLPALNEKKLRATTLLALTKHSFLDRKTLDRVKPYLQSDRGLERALSLKILANNKDTNEGFLEPYLDDEDFNVRLEAYKALKRHAYLPKGKHGPLGKALADRLAQEKKAPPHE